MTKRPERLSKAPIVEALIDIQVDAALQHFEQLGAVKDRARADFPEAKRLFSLQGNIDLSKEKPEVTAAEPAPRGLQFWSSDKKRVMQARLDGFSFSHLAPYDRWQSLRDDARKWWAIYCEVSKPAMVKRHAVRFVNRLDLPAQCDFSEYLRTVPRVADGLPQRLAGLFMQLVVPFESATAIITEVIESSGSPDTVSLILDIDVFETVEMRPEGDDLWQRLEALRQIKNSVFFDSLTPKALRLFE